MSEDEIYCLLLGAVLLLLISCLAKMEESRIEKSFKPKRFLRKSKGKQGKPSNTKEKDADQL